MYFRIASERAGGNMRVKRGEKILIRAWAYSCEDSKPPVRIALS